ncbi:MAG: hypothetical protein P4L40_09850 [Terracidiphilus sp.]|nr:hypothetical protein [Terracidiphilus sp.]
MPQTNETQPASVPDWVEGTPEITYSLAMYGHNDDAAQEIDLTRAEYIELKHTLAIMRGYAEGGTEPPGHEAERCAHDAEGNPLPQGTVPLAPCEWELIKQAYECLHKVMGDLPFRSAE